VILRLRPRRQDGSVVEVTLFPDYEFTDVANAIDEAISRNRPFAVLNRAGTELTFDPRRLDAVALVGA
jgi:hypothetical protein